jgi:hypothetical protein
MDACVEREKREAAGEKFAPRPSRKVINLTACIVSYNSITYTIMLNNMQRRRRGDIPVDESSRSAAESAKKMLITKKFSRKINYAVIDALFDDEPTAIEKEEEETALSPIKYEIVEEPGIEPVKSDTSNNSSSVASPENSRSSQDNTSSGETRVKSETSTRTTNAAEEEEEEEEYDEDDDEDDDECGDGDTHDYGYDEYNDYS